MFQPTLISVDYDAIHIKHLTQVSGPTFKDQPPFITANFTLKVLDEESGEYFEDDRKYHETGVCGDFVSNKGGCYVINKQQEKEKNMIRAPARTKNLVNIHSKTDCKKMMLLMRRVHIILHSLGIIVEPHLILGMCIVCLGMFCFSIHLSHLTPTFP